MIRQEPDDEEVLVHSELDATAIDSNYFLVDSRSEKRAANEEDEHVEKTDSSPDLPRAIIEEEASGSELRNQVIETQTQDKYEADDIKDIKNQLGDNQEESGRDNVFHQLSDPGDVTGYRQRWTALVEELGRQGVHFRHDSRLCSAYLNAELDASWTAQRVAREAATMVWLYNFTNYSELCRESFSRMRHENRHMTWEYVRDHIHPQIKRDTIHRYGGIPAEWPWLAMPPPKPAGRSNKKRPRLA
jgi:hypothetical protein